VWLALIGDAIMKRSPKEWGFFVRPGSGTKLPAGGIYPPYGHIGHWEVTAKVAEAMGFSPPGINVLCDAAQDPDFYEFGTLAAQAQTPDEADQCGSDSFKRTIRLVWIALSICVIIVKYGKGGLIYSLEQEDKFSLKMRK